MTGRLGMEMKPSDLSDREKEYAKNAFATYKKIRPVVQLGNQYRLLSPYDNNGYCSLMYVDDNKTEAVFFAYKFEQYVNHFRPRFYFAGLDANARYKLTELCRDGHQDHWEGSVFTGEFLMRQGIEIALNGVFASKIIHLQKQ
jgi:alpha-galactosidase